MDMDDERGRDKEDDLSSLKDDLVRAKAGLIVHKVMLGFAPVVSVLALIVAVMAYFSNQSNREQIDADKSRIESINANLSESTGEQDVFKVPIFRERSMRAEEHKRQAEREAVIIKNVSQLQVKMKISPTLEEQLREVHSAPVAAAPIVSTPPAASSVVGAPVPSVAHAPEKTEKQLAAKPAGVDKNPVSALSAAKPADTGKNTAPASKAAKPAPVLSAPEKSTKVKALKEAIEQFNKSSE